MEKENIKLTSPEISGLWSTYIQKSATILFFKHFLSYLRDKEIKSVVREVLQVAQSHQKQIEKIFDKESIPIPAGFTDDDLDVSAPALYTDLYALSFVYRLGQVNLHHYGITSSKVARRDVVEFFTAGLKEITELYKRSLALMLSKGIYDRPPKIDYPERVEYVEKQSFIAGWFGEQRPLNSFELGEIFFVIERNYIGLLLLLGFAQVMKDKEIKQYLIKGKELCEKQINAFNDLLRKEDLTEIAPVPMEVTNSLQSPFSDKLILFMVSMTCSESISLIAYGMSVSMRRDVSARYLKVLADIIQFGGEGMKLMIDRGWMEQPPQSFNRRAVLKI